LIIGRRILAKRMAFWVKTALLPFLKPDNQIIKKCRSKQEYKRYPNPVRESKNLLDPRSIKETVY
jgi:hypothetical protein